ncbi:uncharacterized protein [Parasteatoda tepidariorum]|uniref:uncharacterized protein n=1 Tax=Parasteatoda tepidariorum TaxID=114398 RepID=UPI001C722237|nr:uncharacterized protein LOC107450393 [Parasteatoda tepidariorum]
MTTRKKLQVPWLPAPAWLKFPLTKGLNHHRIPVGIILAASSKMECVLESKSLAQVRIRLLNDDKKTEGTFTVKSSQQGRAATFSVGSVSVPFIDSEYLNKDPEDNRDITINYPTGSKALPIYRFGDKEEDFFKLWDSQNAEFAYIESDYIGLLIPKVDKEFARKLPGGKHLDDVILFYDKLFTIYSELIGMSFEETGLNKNVRNRFFLKADKSGAGGAYYSDWCTAVSYGTVKGFWLDIKPTNWGALHEIGHGHELKNINDETLSVGEVWNNVLAFFYQKIMLGKDLQAKGSKMKSLGIADVLKSGNPVKSWREFHKCSFLTHMFFKAGQKSFARFNQRTREEYAGRTYYASGALFVEKLMHFFAIDFAIDVYPFMRLAKAAVRKEQLEEHYYVLSSVAYPLNYLMSDAKEINNLKNKLSLEFETSLVTPSDLSSTNLKNDFTVKIDNQIFEDVSGDMLKLTDGSRVVAERKILSQTIILKDVPIGVYKVFVEPNAKNSKLIYDDFYAIVHADKSGELTLSAKIKKVPSLSPDKIRLLGLGDKFFASLSVEPFKNLVQFNSSSGSPHSYFKNKKYASVTIKNQENKEIFSKSIDGNSPALGLFDIPMEGELQVEIFHAEPKNRLKMENPTMSEIIDRQNTTNYFIVNEKGLQKKNTSKELLEKNFLSKIESSANKIKKKISLYDRPFCLPKYNLLLAVEAFERLFRENGVDKALREQYKDCLPPPVDPKKQ